MKKVTLISILIFLGLSCITLCISFFTEIGLYDAVLETQNEISQSFEKSISLKYLINEKVHVDSLGNPLNVELKGKGWLMVFIINLGIPGLIAYSFNLKKSK